ncbi:hypothetical protein Vafri_4576 [Volvox africanus]|uniref:MYND-type domain-containing protein n=2 Tax=Volvox africanus TaxID=51714 RepID=A0A8J4AXH4_9CHLO|nr:hypothetical protein Vafri_4576 [Volvox africanus]
MFGPVEQIAALIASAAKWVAAITTCTALRLMRKGGRLVPPPSICVHCNSFVIGDGVNGLPETIKSGAELLDMLVDWKKISRLGPFLGRKPAGKATGDGGGDGDGDGDGDDGDNVQGKDGVGGDATAAGARQWASLTAFAAVKLLPPLVKALQMMASKGAPPKCKFCKIGILKSVDTLMEQTMALMGCGAEWRSMLLQEIDLVGLLGAAAKILRTYAVEAKYDELTIQALTTFRTCLMRAKGAFTCQLHDLAARAPPDPVLDTPLEKADLDVLLGHVNPCGPYFLNLPASLLVLGDAQEGGQCPRLPYAYLLPSPDEIRAAMAPHCCANPACLNLEGPSEASLRQRCGDDGGVGSGGARIWYCSRECSQALSNPSYKREGRASAGGLGGVDERRGLAPSGNCISDGGGGA